MKANSNSTNSDNYKVVITPDNVTMDCTDELMECMSDKSNEECVDEYNECVCMSISSQWFYEASARSQHEVIHP